MTQRVQCDVVVIGGGIAGLWLINCLKQQGYIAYLCEKNALGSGQTLRSQGILHGGTKYALTGKLTKAALGVANMPAIWQACLQGKGVLDLRAVKILSNIHYLWMKGRYTAQIKSFITSKVLSEESKVIAAKDYPLLFKYPEFVGSVCAVQETVVDIPSLLRVLSKPVEKNLLQAEETCELIIESEQVKGVLIASQGKQLILEAKVYLLTAGEGNQSLLKQLSSAPTMQRRPLQMTWLRFPKFVAEYQVYFHCVEQGGSPSITITTHQDKAGRTIWYLGGDISESGVQRSPEEQIAFAKRELKRLMPWIDLSNTEWGTSSLDRAEMATVEGKKPESISIEKVTDNLLVGWPTKLVLAPLLAEKLIERINFIEKTKQHDNITWPTAKLARPIWWE
ncbi:MAG: hypothetical protein A3E87_08185 [Gammaproteobacteria bacterium RIFCSPHIGHO2_12_FULL_35_23]|nr:MAG: hypothetical protein A3E87_08185 [Gammaproteobacteria bacterium RIFCSPHIGHO2_12_FULL_35_23]